MIDCGGGSEVGGTVEEIVGDLLGFAREAILGGMARTEAGSGI
jgi:hypothetical protein